MCAVLGTTSFIAIATIFLAQLKSYEVLHII